VKKRIICRLGELSKSEAASIRYALAVERKEDAFAAILDDLLFQEHGAYLDVAFPHEMWQEWALSNAFSATDRQVPTSHVAEIFTINRCRAPGSKRDAVLWFADTVLPWLVVKRSEESTS